MEPVKTCGNCGYGPVAWVSSGVLVGTRMQLTVPVGDRGWIESEKNLTHDGNAWVHDGAKIFGNACVSDNAEGYYYAEVFEKANVYGNARVYGDAHVCGNAWVSKSHHTENVWTLTLDKHTITVDGGYLNIGCESHSIEYWLENFREIGKENDYTPEEIERYGDVIKILAKWKHIKDGGNQE